MTAPILQVQQISRFYGDVRAVDDVSFEIGQGEFFALLGPSGCGKTSIMRLVAGFETPDSGRILVGGQDMNGVPPNRRPVNMMFQSYALFPHMSVERNVAFGLVQQGMGKAEIAGRVADMLRLVRLEGLGARRPDQLSGGQKQRVALARALAPRPKLLLLDEPLAALDRKLREETQFELMQVQRDLGIAFMMVTHDQDEAMIMAQRIALMQSGKIIQTGSPREIYDAPQSLFAAEFIGEANIFQITISTGDSGVRFQSAGALNFDFMAKGQFVPGPAEVAVRPERMKLAAMPMGCAAEGEGIVIDQAWLGDLTIWRVQMGDGRIVKISRSNAGPGLPDFSRGDKVFVGFDADALRVLTP